LLFLRTRRQHDEMVGFRGQQLRKWCSSSPMSICTAIGRLLSRNIDLVLKSVCAYCIRCSSLRNRPFCTARPRSYWPSLEPPRPRQILLERAEPGLLEADPPAILLLATSILPAGLLPHGGIHQRLGKFNALPPPWKFMNSP